MNKTIVHSSLLCFVIVVILFVASCGGGDKSKGAQQPAATPVTIQEVRLQPALYYDEYPGTTIPLSQVEIRAEVNGYVTGIFFKEGEHVRKGQKLYEIDRRKYEAAFQQAQANLTQSKANQDRAQKDADRYIYLSKQDAVAKQILDHALTDLQNAKAGVANSAAAANSARIDMNYATITAPFDGTIGLSQVKLGALIAQGQTLLNTISTEDPMAVDFVVNEKEIPRFSIIAQQGNNTPVKDSLFTLRLANSTTYNQPGRLSVIDRAVNRQTGAITIRLVFPNAEGSLKAGMSCAVRVHNQEAQMQLMIPTKATIEQMGENFIFIAKDTVIVDSSKSGKKGGEGSDNKSQTAGADKKESGPHLVALQRKVILGRVIGQNVIVKSGLTEGERVVVDGVQKLKDGAAIATAAGPAQAQQGSSGGKSSNTQSSGSGGTAH